MAESIVAGRLEEALYQTCILLIEERTDVLENIWIGAIARLGDAGDCDASGHRSINSITWYAVCKDIWAACSADGIRVKEALLVTGKLTLLARQLYNAGVGLGGIGSSSVARLRSQVIGFFPETGVRLSQRGYDTFSRILPSREDERLFAERLLVGFSQLWDGIGTGAGEESAASSLDLRLAMEFLLRKRQIGLHCARVGQQDMWPYPSLEESDKGDVVWFLWGAWMAKFTWAEPLWRLFSLNFKRGLRTERLGLMMGCRGLLSLPPGIRVESSTSVWGETEKAALAYIEENSGAMWKEAVDASGSKKVNKKPVVVQDSRSSCGAYESNVWNYVPRVGAPQKQVPQTSAPKRGDSGATRGKREHQAKSYDDEDDESYDEDSMGGYLNWGR